MAEAASASERPRRKGEQVCLKGQRGQFVCIVGVEQRVLYGQQSDLWPSTLPEKIEKFDEQGREHDPQ